MPGLGTTTTHRLPGLVQGDGGEGGGCVSPPGQHQGAVSQDAHLSQLLKSLLGIFLEEKKVRSRDLGESRGLQCGIQQLSWGETALLVKPQGPEFRPQHG